MTSNPYNNEECIDADPAEVRILYSRHAIVRKRRQCGVCGRDFHPGDTVRREISRDGDTIVTAYYCPDPNQCNRRLAGDIP